MFCIFLINVGNFIAFGTYTCAGGAHSCSCSFLFIVRAIHDFYNIFIKTTFHPFYIISLKKSKIGGSGLANVELSKNNFCTLFQNNRISALSVTVSAEAMVNA